MQKSITGSRVSPLSSIVMLLPVGLDVITIECDVIVTAEPRSKASVGNVAYRQRVRPVSCYTYSTVV